MNRKLIIIGVLLLCTSIVLRIVWLGLKNFEPDEFKPAAVIFIVDSSASNQKNLPEQKKFLKQICSTLDPEDQVKIIKVSQDSYLIYEGAPHNGSEITKAMEAFTKYNPEELGTAYGEAMKKAFSHALSMKKEGYVPSVVVIGDLENEGDTSKQINWDLLPDNIKNVQKYAPELSMMFLFAHPKKLDMVKEKLNPILGEKKLITAPEQTAEKSLRKFIHALGR